MREDAVDDAVTALGVREAGPGRGGLGRRVNVRRTLEDRYFKDVEYGGTQSAEEDFGRQGRGSATAANSSRRARVRGAVIDEDGLPFEDMGETVSCRVR